MSLEPFSYEEILKGRDKYRELLKDLSLENAVHPNSRVFQAYKILEDSLPFHKDHAALTSYRKRINLETGDLYAILAELGELYQLFMNIDVLERNEELAEKIKAISSGQYNFLEENTTNTNARNIQFELRLAADLIKGGADIKIGDDNPDLMLDLKNEKAGIECKRISAAKQFKRNFKEAREQIKTAFEANKYDQGIIAISISRIMHDEEKAMRANDLMFSRQELMSHVGNTTMQLMRSFVTRHEHIWLNDDRLAKMKIPAVILHYRVVVFGGIHGLGVFELFSPISAKKNDTEYNTFMASFRANFKHLRT